jgi:arabinofuranosyltransferase
MTIIMTIAGPISDKARTAWWLQAAACLLFLTGAFLIIHKAWITEDTFISLRCVDNFLAGHGPVFNPGERVEASTHALWFYILALFRWSGLGPKAAAIAPGLLFSLLALFLIFFKITWDRRPHARPLAWGGAILIGMSSFSDFGTSGLESALTYFLLAWMAYAVIRGTWSAKPWLMGLIVSLLVLNRPDFVVFLAFWLAIYGWRAATKSMPFRSAALFLAFPAILTGGYEIFRMGYYASLLPNPFYAKSGGAAYYSQGLIYLADLLKGSFLAGLAALCLAWIALRRKMAPGEYAQRWLILLPGLLHGFFVVRGGGDFMHGRFLLPLAVLAAISCSDLMRGALQKVRPAPWISAVLLSSLFLVSICIRPLQRSAGAKTVNGIADERFLYLELFGNNLTREWQSQGAIVRRLSMRTGLPISYCYGNIGYFGYYAGPTVYVMDFLGLADPIVARMPAKSRGRPGHEKSPPFAYLAYRGLTFQETPFAEWNRLAATPFGPLWDLSPATLKKFAFFLPAKFKENLDQGILERLIGYSAQISEKDADYLYFLQRFWQPCAPTAGQERLAQLCRLHGIEKASPLAAWIGRNRPAMDDLLGRIRAPLTLRLFLDNIRYSLKVPRLALTPAPDRWRPRQARIQGGL